MAVFPTAAAALGARIGYSFGLGHSAVVAIVLTALLMLVASTVVATVVDACLDPPAPRWSHDWPCGS